MKIVIIGAGGQGRVVLDILRQSHQFEVAGFLDADSTRHRIEIDGLEIIGGPCILSTLKDTLRIGGAIVAIGDNGARVKYAQNLQRYRRAHLVNAIHPSATIAESAKIGKNVVVAAGANICTHVDIGDSVICNTGCIIDHESVIADGAHICPGVKIAGRVQVGESAFIGIGATIIQNVTIGEEAVVGAGSVIIKDVPAGAKVVGVPGVEIERKKGYE